MGEDARSKGELLSEIEGLRRRIVWLEAQQSGEGGRSRHQRRAASRHCAAIIFSSWMKLRDLCELVTNPRNPLS